jgi:Asp-tRNA(Asn)/Glu-tRNA(Gln) amidotransferase A subunit family amidase
MSRGDHTGGGKAVQHPAPATKDAFAIRQLANAGATLAGTLNMDAYAYGFTTENSHYGATRNPRDLTRVAGGSSGGSAAAVAGLVNFALGTDTNGSIRVPASLCGVLGLKPTFGRLSRSGSHPFVASLDHIGPLARNVEDLACVYDALLGHDGEDNWQSHASRSLFCQRYPLRGRYAVPCWRAILQPGVLPMPVPPSTRWRRRWEPIRRGYCRKRNWRVPPHFCFLRQRG